GAVMVSDWVSGWGLTGKGRLWRVSDPERTKSQDALQTKTLLAEGFKKRPNAELAGLLGHVDRRVRQEAHFRLAARGNEGHSQLVGVAKGGTGLARLHAIWGLGIAARGNPALLAGMTELLGDPDAEVRAQALRVIGEGRLKAAVD